MNEAELIQAYADLARKYHALLDLVHGSPAQGYDGQLTFQVRAAEVDRVDQEGPPEITP